METEAVKFLMETCSKSGAEATLASFQPAEKKETEGPRKIAPLLAAYDLVGKSRGMANESAAGLKAINIGYRPG